MATTNGGGWKHVQRRHDGYVHESVGQRERGVSEAVGDDQREPSTSRAAQSGF